MKYFFLSILSIIPAQVVFSDTVTPTPTPIQVPFFFGPTPTSTPVLTFDETWLSGFSVGSEVIFICDLMCGDMLIGKDCRAEVVDIDLDFQWISVDLGKKIVKILWNQAYALELSQ